MNEKTLQFKSLTVLLLLVTVAFIWILLPFYGAVFWAVILGIVFAPLQRRLLMRLDWRRNLAAGIGGPERRLCSHVAMRGNERNARRLMRIRW